MLCTAYLNVMLDPARNPDALSGAIDAIAARFTADETSEVRLHVQVGRNRRLLDFIGTALGRPLAGSTCQENLLTLLDWHAAWRLVGEVARADPAWIRGAGISIVASALLLAEGRRDVAWRVVIQDLARLRKKRGMMTVRASFKAPGIDRPEIRKLLGELEPSAGFPMRRAHLDFAGETPLPGSPDAVALAALERLGQSLPAMVAEQLRPMRLRWADFPLMETRDEAQDRRFKRMLEGTASPKVNFDALARAFARDRFPDFLFERHADGIDLVISTGHQAETVVRLLTAGVHIGKSFAVELSVRVSTGPLAGRLIARPYSRSYWLGDFVDNAENFGWAYETADDARRALDEAGRLLDLALPRIADHAGRFFEQRRSPAPVAPGHHHALTFHQAVAIAARALGRFRQEAHHVIGAWLRGPGSAAPCGRLAQDQSWLLRFANLASGRHVDVHVPADGPLGFAMGYSIRVMDEAGVHQLIRSPRAATELVMLGAPDLDPIGYTERLLSGLAGLADSPDIMEYAEAQGGAAFRQRHPGAHVALQLRRGSGPIGQWNVLYAAKGSPDRDTLSIATSVEKPVQASVQPPSIAVRH